jgi:hypothetical protein
VFRLVGRRGWDICGPFPESLGGKGRYMLLFIDDATRYTWCYILEHKSDAEAKFHDWEAEMQTQYSLQVKRFRTDGGGEFTSKRFLQHLRDHGIHKETTATVSIEARRLPILPLSSISLPTSFIRVMLTWSRSLPLICSPDVTDPQARSDLLTSLLSMTMVSRSHSPFRYTDYHDALRSGDTGRLEHSSDILCVMFQGLSKLKNYRALSLEFKACRVKEWTDEMRELWL